MAFSTPILTRLTITQLHCVCTPYTNFTPIGQEVSKVPLETHSHRAVSMSATEIGLANFCSLGDSSNNIRTQFNKNPTSGLVAGSRSLRYGRRHTRSMFLSRRHVNKHMFSILKPLSCAFCKHTTWHPLLCTKCNTEHINQYNASEYIE